MDWISYSQFLGYFHRGTGAGNQPLSVTDSKGVSLELTRDLVGKGRLWTGQEDCENCHG